MLDSVEPLSSDDPQRIGRYAVLGRLGAGGMGRVYLGRSPGGLPVAVKVIHARFARDERFRARFRQEVTAARAVSGAFTAPVVDAELDGESPWLVTAYVPGPSLEQAVRTYGPFTVEAASALGAALAEAVGAIHRAGVVHRDLKPGNVLLGPDGPLVIDFGIAYAAEAAGLTRAGSVMGTPGYMPPEQAAGEKVGPPGDVFALGAVLTFAATGVGPYGQANAAALLYRVVHEPPRLGSVPGPLRDVVAACLARDPAARPAPDRLLRELAAAPSGTDWLPAAVAAEIGRREEATARLTAPRGVRRRPVLFGGAALLATGGAGVAALTAFRHGPRKPPPTAPDRRLLWRYVPDTALGVHADPVVAGGVVYVGSDQGDLYAVDARTGRLRWKAGDAPNGLTVLAATGRLVLTADRDGAVGARRTSDGEDAWGDEPVVTGETGIAVAADRVYVANGGPRSGSVRALRLADGSTAWDRSTGDPADAGLAVAGGLLYVPGRHLHALAAADGRPRWEYAMERASAPAVAGGVVYCGDYQAGRLHAVDAGTGRRRWAAEVGAGVPTRPAVSAGTVYAGDVSGVLHAFDTSGRVRWRYRTGGEISGGPVAAGNGLILVTGSDAYLYAVRPDGRLAWRYQVGREASAPAVSGDAVYFGAADGTLHAISAGA